MADDSDEEKQHEPTQKKLDDARKKGDIPRSADLLTAASYGGLLLVAMSAGGASLLKIGSVLTSLLDKPDLLAEQVFSEGGSSLAGGLMAALALPLLPWFAGPALFVCVVIAVQQSFVVTPDKLMPKLNRISPISLAGQKFGRNGLFEFGKSFAKLLIVSVILGFFVASRLPEILSTMALEPGLAMVILLRLAVSFLLIVLLVTGVIGALDLLWQRAEHIRKNRMSHKEMMDEFKESEGDPHLKAQRRQRGYQIAMSQMIADVPKADVVVVNPTHYAVALKWSRERGTAPICVAKGVDEIAARIREKAQEAGVPLHSDPPTARALHATVEIGEEIRPEHYRAVAAAIRFAEAMRKKAWKRK